MSSLADQRLFDLSAIAARTGISPRTWRRLIAAGKIGVLRIEGSVRIPEAELERFLAERFVPARILRRDLTPSRVEEILDRHAPRLRGRPRIAGSGEAR